MDQSEKEAENKVREAMKYALKQMDHHETYEKKKSYFRCTLPLSADRRKCGFVGNFGQVSVHMSKHWAVTRGQCTRCEQDLYDVVDIFGHKDKNLPNMTCKHGHHTSHTPSNWLAHMQWRARNIFIKEISKNEYDAWKDVFEKRYQSRAATPAYDDNETNGGKQTAPAERFAVEGNKLTSSALAAIRELAKERNPKSQESSSNSKSVSITGAPGISQGATDPRLAATATSHSERRSEIETEAPWNPGPSSTSMGMFNGSYPNNSHPTTSAYAAQNGSLQFPADPRNWNSPTQTPQPMATAAPLYAPHIPGSNQYPSASAPADPRSYNTPPPAPQTMTTAAPIYASSIPGSQQNPSASVPQFQVAPTPQTMATAASLYSSAIPGSNQYPSALAPADSHNWNTPPPAPQTMATAAPLHPIPGSQQYPSAAIPQFRMIFNTNHTPMQQTNVLQQIPLPSSVPMPVPPPQESRGAGRSRVDIHNTVYNGPTTRSHTPGRSDRDEAIAAAPRRQPLLPFPTAPVVNRRTPSAVRDMSPVQRQHVAQGTVPPPRVTRSGSRVPESTTPPLPPPQTTRREPSLGRDASSVQKQQTSQHVAQGSVPPPRVTRSGSRVPESTTPPLPPQNTRRRSSVGRDVSPVQHPPSSQHVAQGTVPPFRMTRSISRVPESTTPPLPPPQTIKREPSLGRDESSVQQQQTSQRVAQGTVPPFRMTRSGSRVPESTTPPLPPSQNTRREPSLGRDESSVQQQPTSQRVAQGTVPPFRVTRSGSRVPESTTPPLPPSQNTRRRSSVGRDVSPVQHPPSSQPVSRGAAQPPPQNIRRRQASAVRESVEEIAMKSGLKRSRPSRCSTPVRETTPEPSTEQQADGPISKVSLKIVKPQDMTRQRRSSVSYRSTSRGRSSSRHRDEEKADMEKIRKERQLERSKGASTVKVPPSNNRQFMLSNQPTLASNPPPQDPKTAKADRLRQKLSECNSLASNPLFGTVSQQPSTSNAYNQRGNQQPSTSTANTQRYNQSPSTAPPPDSFPVSARTRSRVRSPSHTRSGSRSRSRSRSPSPFTPAARNQNGNRRSNSRGNQRGNRGYNQSQRRNYNNRQNNNWHSNSRGF
ncbi:hypothetical protein CAEBREN_25174 [Caenorhabditis brenneri]|uniref:Uncharacterized protein n=1 Tax=Caenorhabditis brenneri TaxID=135651 RepID=G0NMK2_CAEBE|nr:hypothetical protein CAEBREN_25174 [Caenorhabditis brenneri]